MSPGWKRMPCSVSRQRGLRRRRNSRSIPKCLNSSPCASSMIARASGSCSTASRCSYQLIASASSISDVQMRAKVRVSAESSLGGSWYCSVGIGRRLSEAEKVRAVRLDLAVAELELARHLLDDRLLVLLVRDPRHLDTRLAFGRGVDPADRRHKRIEAADGGLQWIDEQRDDEEREGSEQQ